jgi:UPF0755 protein
MNLNKIIFKIISISFSILVALLVIVGLFKLGTFCYEFGYRVFTEAPVDEEPGRDVVVQVTADMSEHEIGKLLENKGLINDGNLFLAQLKLSAYSGELKPGVYTLNTSMTAKEMMAVMAAEESEPTEDTEGAESVEGVLDENELDVTDDTDTDASGDTDEAEDNDSDITGETP